MFALKGNGQIFYRELLSHQGINEILMTKRITFMSYGESVISRSCCVLRGHTYNTIFTMDHVVLDGFEGM
jgi:hypothetical protein